MTPRKKLSDILHNSQREQLGRAFAEAKAAEEFGPLPAGEYVCRIIEGAAMTGRTNGTPGYKLTFEVIEGEYAKRRIWHDIWLTEANVRYAKRDLAKLGVTSLDMLDNQLPEGIRCKVRVVLRKEDDGTERNRVRSFEVLGIDTPEPFAPAEGDLAAGEHGDTSFDPSTLPADGKLFDNLKGPYTP
jgi:hypothetical protein